MNPLISVIVPIYKVEPYLSKCIDSIRNSTLQDMEIILVDDGSPDRCGQICDEYAAIDSRIRVIHKENGGLSSARNAGLDIARGELIGFVDSDDWIEPDMYEFLYNNLVKEDADISVCGILNHRGKSVNPLGDPSISAVASGHDAMQIYLMNGTIGNATWNKLYRRKMYSQVRFPVGRIFEDGFIMPSLIDSASRVVYDLTPKYHYLRRADSLSAQYYRPELRDYVDVFAHIYSYVRERYPDLSEQARAYYVWAHFYVLDAMILHDGPVDLQDKKKYIHYLRKNVSAVLRHPVLTKARKISMLALCIHESLYEAIIKWQHR